MAEIIPLPILHGGKTTIDVIGSAPRGDTGLDQHRHRPPVIVEHRGKNASDTADGDSGHPSRRQRLGRDILRRRTGCRTRHDVRVRRNVRSAYDGTGPGTVIAYSPVTDKTYAMSCSAGYAVVCTGGDDASVYFPSDSAGAAYETTQPSSGEATPEVAHAGSYSGETSCGDELSVGPDTSCTLPKTSARPMRTTVLEP